MQACKQFPNCNCVYVNGNKYSRTTLRKCNQSYSSLTKRTRLCDDKCCTRVIYIPPTELLLNFSSIVH